MASRLPASPETPARLVPALLPIGLALVAAALPVSRPAVVVVLLAGTGVALWRRSELVWTWAAPVAVVVSLCWELLPAPVADPAGADCVRLASPPAVWRLLEAVLVLAVVAGLASALRSPWSEIGFRAPPRPVVGLSVLALAVLGPLALLLGAALGQPFFGSFRLDLSQPAALLPALVFGLSNATLEEVAYRGVLLRWTARVGGLGLAVAGQALLFGVAHGGDDFVGSPLPVMAAMVAGGAVAAWIAIRTNSLLLPIAAHAALDLPLYLYFACRG